jgi:flagellar export protein FliJ
MSPRWLNSLVRARQLQEDAAKQNLATAERLARRAQDRVRLVDERLDSLVAVEAEQSVPAFVAAAAALQAIAATHAAARHAAAEAEGEVARTREDLGDSARRRMGAEELQDRYVSGERARAAAHAQRDLDEIAARVHRDRMEGVQ